MNNKKFYKVYSCGEYIIEDNGQPLIGTQSEKDADLTIAILNDFYEKNKELNSELKEFKDYVYSDKDISSYSCMNCTKKGLYLSNKQYGEIMLLRSECTRLIILLKNIVKDLKQMDTKKYAEHIEKNIDFLSKKYLEEDDMKWLMK